MSHTIWEVFVGMLIVVSWIALLAWVAVGLGKVLDWFSKVNGYADDIQWNGQRLDHMVNEMRSENHALKERMSQLEGKKK